MLLLYETPAGIAFFRSENTEENNERNNVELVEFRKYKNAKNSFKSNLKLSKGKIPKTLKKMIKSNKDALKKESLALYDKKLGKKIKKKMKIDCIYNDSIFEILRIVRSNFDKYVSEDIRNEIKELTVTLSHSLSTKKLAITPEKTDLMIIQAISLLDEIDKEVNTYLMRIKEWYGWHFPELNSIIENNETYVKVVIAMGSRNNKKIDLSNLLNEEEEEKIQKAVNISMGTDIGTDDEKSIKKLCEQYLQMSEYRNTLQEYLKNRVQAISPNLFDLVGETIAAKLIAKAGSLLNLAKCPASTIQIFGAEKALFRALKTKSKSPKYGIIYHSKIVGQQNAKNKGKAARVLANKLALAARVDALSKKPIKEISAELKIKIDKQLSGRGITLS